MKPPTIIKRILSCKVYVYYYKDVNYKFNLLNFLLKNYKPKFTPSKLYLIFYTAITSKVLGIN